MRIPTLLLAFALVSIAAQPALAQTCTTSWASPASGTWSDDGNWTNGAPDAGDTACITAPGTYVVTLDRRQALDGLIVGGASGLQTLIMDGTLAPLGSGTIGPNGRVELTSSENCASCDGLPDVTGTLTVEGTLVHERQVGLVSQGGTLDVAPGGLLLVRTGLGSGNFGGRSAEAVSTVRVRGRAEFSAGGQTPQRTSVLGIVEIDGGTFAVPEGRVDLAADGALRNAAFEIGETADVTLTNANSNGASGVFEAAGTLSGVVQGSLRLTSGGTLAAGPGDATLALTGTGLRVDPGSGQTAFFTSTGGAFTNTGLLTAAGNGLWLRDAVLRNEGTLDVRTTLRMEQGAEIENTASGEVLFVDQGSITGGPDGGLLRSAGRLAGALDTRTTATSRVSVPAELDGAGVEVEAGVRLQLGEGSLRNVAFVVLESGEVLLSNANTNGLSGDFAVEGTLSGDVQGTVRLSGARFLARPAGATLAFAGNGVTIAGYGLGTEGGALLNTGRLTFVNNVPEVRGVALRNEGALAVINATLRLSEGAELTNAVGATAEMASGGSVTPVGDAGGLFVNEGLVLKTAAGSTQFDNTLRSRPGSELRALEGRFFFRDEDPAHYGAGVLLSGTGDVYMSPPRLMQGTISPGTPEAPVDTLGFPGYFRLDDAEGDARLVIDLGPDGMSDHIATNNTIVLGGTLIVRVLGGYTPAFGDAFTIIRDLRNNAVQGAFSSIEVEGAPEGVSFAVDTSQPGAVVLRAAAAVAVSAPVATTPEGQPAPFVLTHPASAEPFSIDFALGGTATRFADYTVSATGHTVRAQPNTTQTVVTLYPRRDADPNEGPEAVTLEVLLSGGAVPAPDAGEAGIAITDGPSTDALALDAVVPARGSNLGTVTPTVLGQGFGESAVVYLTGPATIQGEAASVAPTGTGVAATFDLAGAPAGRYDVVVESGGETATLPGAFTVVEGERRVPIWADVVGTPAPRFGRWSTYTFTIGNDGDADLYDTFAILRLPAGVEYEVSGVILPDDLDPEMEELVGLDVGTAIVIPLYVYKLAARATRSVEVRVRPVAPVAIGDGVGVSYELYPPNPDAAFTYSGDFADFDADRAARIPTNWGTLGGALELALQEIEDGGRPAGSVTAAVLGQFLKACPNNEWANRDERNMTAQELNDMYSSANRFNENRGEIAANAPTPWVELAVFSIGVLVAPAAAAAGLTTVAVVATVTAVVAGVSAMATASSSANRISRSTSSDGNRPGAAFAGLAFAATDPPSPTGGPGGGPSGGVGGGACGPAGGSFDPNDKLGPAGAGEARFYDPATVATPYVIRFENLETASFPAQEVVIVDDLDTDLYDLSTFSLGPIRWGEGNVVTPPPGATAFEAEVDLAPDLDAALLITAALDNQTGRVTWTFTTLDPETGDLPEDGLVGFLPPNVNSPEGEGSVSFRVKAWDGLATGTAVSNSAEIVFDINEPIVTPVWTNTVDVAAPVTSVEPLGEVAANPVTISVAGSDDGSGLYLYRLFASRNGGPFELVATSTEPTFEFEGEVGSAYGFYSIASDFVLNTEPPKSEAEAMTVVAVSAEGEATELPREVTLASPYPNPARGEATFRWGLPNAGHVDLRVYDLLGREVARLASDDAHEAGWHTMRWRVHVASGVYVVRLDADTGRERKTVTQRLVVVR